MMDLALIIGIGIALLVLLILAGRRPRVNEGASLRMPQESEFLVRLPHPGVLGRCLSIEDVEFASGLGSAPVLHLLLTERRRLALQWLRQTRREASRLFRLHLRTVRYAADLRPAAEFRLLLRVVSFVFVYEFLSGVVRLYGPLRTKGFLETVHSVANVLANLGGRIAESAVPIPIEARN